MTANARPIDLFFLDLNDLSRIRQSAQDADWPQNGAIADAAAAPTFLHVRSDRAAIGKAPRTGRAARSKIPLHISARLFHRPHSQAVGWEVVMVSSMLALALAVMGGQATDTTRSSREAFTACLRGYVDRSLDAGTTAEAFRTEYPQQCATQEATFRQAVIQRERQARMSQADAEESAGLEIEDARTNFSERFEMAMPAQPPAPPAAPPAPQTAETQPAAQPAVQQAAQQTPQP